LFPASRKANAGQARRFATVSVLHRYSPLMSSPTRWAGVPAAERVALRRALLVHTAYDLFGRGGEAEVAVRSVCRAANLNHRYFYESFESVDELLGAVYDQVYGDLRRALRTATFEEREDRLRLRAGIAAVLDFSSADRRRGEILFTGAPINPVLVARRAAAQQELRQYIFWVRQRADAESDRLTAEVAAAICAGATTELNQQWLAGTLGDDLDAVIDRVVQILVPD